jgi:hypothetical protein
VAGGPGCAALLHQSAWNQTVLVVVVVVGIEYSDDNDNDNDNDNEHSLIPC